MPRIEGGNNIISTRNIVDIDVLTSNISYSGASSPANIPINSNIVLAAGENLTAGDLGTIKDNLIYKATNLLSDLKAPLGIILATVLIDAQATLITTGIVNIATTLTPNDKVYLRAGSPNTNQTILDVVSGTENLVIEVGKALTVNSFIIDIKEKIKIF